MQGRRALLRIDMPAEEGAEAARTLASVLKRQSRVI